MRSRFAVLYPRVVVGCRAGDCLPVHHRRKGKIHEWIKGPLDEAIARGIKENPPHRFSSHPSGREHDSWKLRIKAVPSDVLRANYRGSSSLKEVVTALPR